MVKSVIFSISISSSMALLEQLLLKVINADRGVFGRVAAHFAAERITEAWLEQHLVLNS